MVSVVSEFFLNEFDAYVRDALRRALAAGRPAYLTLSIFNVRLDPEAALATIEDELDPDPEETVNLAEFARMVEEHKADAR